jgi:hypothetical protein
MFTRSYERVDCKRELVPAFTSSQCIDNKLRSHLFTRSYERVDCKRELVLAFTSSHSVFSMSSQVSKTRRTSTRIERFVFMFPRSHVPIFVSLLSSVRLATSRGFLRPSMCLFFFFVFFFSLCVCLF